MKKSTRMALALALCTGSWMGTVHAEESPSASNSTYSYEAGDVIVSEQTGGSGASAPSDFVDRRGTTGFLGEKDAMETPFSTTNITSETITSFSHPSQPLDSVLSIAPSIRATGSILHNDFQMRGFRANGTSTYVNGVPGMFTQFNAPIYVVEKADVLSGPNSGISGTGTQYESTAAGGLVNFTTKRAGGSDLSRLSLGYSGQSMKEMYLDISRRFGVNKDWGLRVMAENVDGETSVDNQKVKSQSIYINLDHEDEKSKTNLFTGYRQNEIIGGQRWFQIGANVTRLPAVPKASRNYSFEGMDKESYGWMAILNHEQRMSKDWKAFINAGWLENKLNKNVMYQYSALTILDDAGNFHLNEQTTTTPQRAKYLQVGVQGKFRSGKTAHELTLAADWTARQRDAAVDGSKTYSLGTGNIYSGVMTQTRMPITGYTEARNNKTAIRGISIVDSITFEKWNVLLGIHHHSATVRGYNLKTGVESSHVDSGATTPTFAVSYRPDQATTVYAHHAEYFDVGSIVSSSYKNAGEILPPAKTKQNEIGVKYENRGLLYTLALYDIVQANNIAVTEGVDRYYRQNGKERHRGIEWGISGKLSPKWTLAAGLSYLRASYEKTAGGTLDNTVPDGQPRWNGTLMARYAADERYSVFARINHTGSSYTCNEKFTVPSNTVFDFGMEYRTKCGTVPTTIGLTLYNAFNKEYWMASRSAKSLYLSTPRTIALSVRMDF